MHDQYDHNTDIGEIIHLAKRNGLFRQVPAKGGWPYLAPKEDLGSANRATGNDKSLSTTTSAFGVS
jgi:hypothetical protein